MALPCVAAVRVVAAGGLCAVERVALGVLRPLPGSWVASAVRGPVRLLVASGLRLAVLGLAGL